MDNATTPVLRRMAASRVAADAGAQTLAQPVAILLGKVSRSVLGLAAAASAVATGQVALADLAPRAPRGALLVLLAQGDAPAGLVALDGGVAAALSEYRLTGLLAARSGPWRPVTDIDAELLRDFVDAALTGLRGILPDAPAALRFGGHLPDIRTLPYVLPPGRLDWLSAELSLGEGETHGPLLVALPQGWLSGAPPARARPGHAAVWRDRLRAAVTAAPAPLDAVLHRLRLPLARVQGLAPGDRIALPRDALDRVAVEAPGRLRVATGRLGQARGLRAVRIGAPPAAEGDVGRADREPNPGPG
jgi:flagellar motor switch protein FliM